MMGETTPGPWFIEAHGIMDATRSRTICLFGDSPQDDADQRLVASAPELRRILEEGVRLFRHVYPSVSDFAHEAQMWTLAAEQVLSDYAE